MTHWEYMDEPHFVVTRELRMHALEQQRKNHRQPLDQKPGTPQIS